MSTETLDRRARHVPLNHCLAATHRNKTKPPRQSSPYMRPYPMAVDMVVEDHAAIFEEQNNACCDVQRPICGSMAI